MYFFCIFTKVMNNRNHHMLNTSNSHRSKSRRMEVCLYANYVQLYQFVPSPPIGSLSLLHSCFSRDLYSFLLILHWTFLLILNYFYIFLYLEFTPLSFSLPLPLSYLLSLFLTLYLAFYSIFPL